MAPGFPHQDHDGLPDLRGDQRGQADARDQDRLLGDRQPPGPHQARSAGGQLHYGRGCAAGPDHQVRQRRGGDAGRGRGRLARGLRGADERHRRPPRHDAHPVRQRQRPAGARADHHRARPGQAVGGGGARLSRVRAHVGDARRQGRQAPPAQPQRLAHQLCRRRRPENRLHLRQRLQRGCQRNPRRPQDDRGGAGRAPRAASAACAPPTCSSMASRRRRGRPYSPRRRSRRLPVAEDVKGPTTIRQLVRSYVCGTGGRRRAVAKTKKKGQAVSEQQKAPVKKRARKASAPAASPQ